MKSYDNRSTGYQRFLVLAVALIAGILVLPASAMAAK
jgi:hypothetical protein